MKDYDRNYPEFAACGLNCGLCPRYYTDGGSRCPGCGGENFSLKHPACGIISCTKKHNAEYCFECGEYPCKRYEENEIDSFITYKNVAVDFERAKTFGMAEYRSLLDEKMRILQFLIENYNDGKRKNYYCVAVNLLPLADLKEILETARKTIAITEPDIKSGAMRLSALLEGTAKLRGIELKLRKKVERT